MEKDVILTREGLQKLKDELDNLKTVRRKEVSERLKTAIDFGDISENAEYDDAKNEQAFIEGRIKTIETMLRNVRIIDEDDASEDTRGHVRLGSKVRVLDIELDDEETYRIVGSTEANPMQNTISNESPLGQALIGHAAGDEVEVDAPVGRIVYRILSVE